MCIRVKPFAPNDLDCRRQIPGVTPGSEPGRGVGTAGREGAWTRPPGYEREIVIRIRKPAQDELQDILHLLHRAELPAGGVEEHLSTFLVAEENGWIVACAGLEIEEDAALLRSVAVAPAWRSRGLGIEIVRQALRLAAASGSTTVYLLTMTAAPFFGKLGFKPCLRAEIEASFPRSSETAPGSCCASAEPMALRDLSRILAPHPRA
jgi:amino-acid N-acetyltransferase